MPIGGRKSHTEKAEILNNSVFRLLLDYFSFITLYYFLIFFEMIFNQNFTHSVFSEINSKHKYAIKKYITDSEIDDIAIIICRETAKCTKREIHITLLQ